MENKQNPPSPAPFEMPTIEEMKKLSPDEQKKVAQAMCELAASYERPQTVLSQEEAMEAILEREKIPNFAKRLFGKTIPDQLVELFHSEASYDANLLFLTGGLSKEELTEYLIQIPEYQEFYSKLEELAEKMVYAVKSTLHKRISGFMNEHNSSSIFPLIEKIHEFIYSQLLPYESPRNSALDLLERKIISKLVFAYYDYLRNIGQSDYLKRYIERLEKGFKIDEMVFSPVASALILLDGAIKSARKIQSNLTDWCALYAKEHPQTDNAAMFADILELTQFRKIAGHKVEINGAAIAFPEEIEMPDAIRPYCLAIISIGFDKEDVVAQINRANGELYLATTSIHLSKIIGKERYPAIKQAVYQVLIDYLENKDEDIEEKLCATPGIRPKSMWQKARHSIKKIFVPEPEPAEKEPDAGAAPEPPSFWDPSRAAPAGREERNGKFTLSNLRGLKAERVIAALTRLLGPAVRVTGSHHFFQTRDGRTYPISVHPGKAVGTGLLRKCLNQMGVTPEELYATL